MALTELGYKVKLKLLEQGIKQQRLANELGVKKQVLSQVINGHSANLKLEESLRHFVKTGEIRKELYDGTNN